MNNNESENKIKTKKYGVLELRNPEENYDSKDLYIAKFKFPKKLHKDDYYTIVCKDYGSFLGHNKDIFYNDSYNEYDEIKIDIPIEKCKEYIECDKDLVKTFCKLNKINPNKKVICNEESDENKSFPIINLHIYIVEKYNTTYIFIGSTHTIRYEEVKGKYKYTDDNYFKDVLTNKEYINVKIIARIPLIAYLKGYPKGGISKKILRMP